MRETPTWRIPFGVLMLVAVLAIYAIGVATLIPPLIGHWAVLGQTPVYIVAGRGLVAAVETLSDLDGNRPLGLSANFREVIRQKWRE